jgi:hypothetical protein
MNTATSEFGTYETFTEGRIKTALSLITDIAEAFIRLGSLGVQRPGR